MPAIYKNGEKIKVSHVTTILINYGNKIGVSKIKLDISRLNPRNGELTIHYSDGAIGTAIFAEYQYMIKWVNQRKKWANVICEYNIKTVV